MKFRNCILALMATSACLSVCAMTAADKDEYDKLGLSQVEWEMIKKADMSKAKLHNLLKCGISITEYFKSPWKDLDMSESEWVYLRCQGQSSVDIKTRENNQSVSAASHDEWAPIRSFFLPGVSQIARKQALKGWTMTGLALLSIGAFAGYSASAKAFQPVPLFFLVSDMLWSAIDIGIQVQREQNPDAARFSNNIFGTKCFLTATINF